MSKQCKKVRLCVKWQASYNDSVYSLIKASLYVQNSSQRGGGAPKAPLTPSGYTTEYSNSKVTNTVAYSLPIPVDMNNIVPCPNILF